MAFQHVEAQDRASGRMTARDHGYGGASPLVGRARPGRRGGRLATRLAAFVLAAALALFAGGFLVFAHRAATAEPPRAPRADAIVVLTGGRLRIDEALALLDRGSGARLLISGVNESTSRAMLARVTEGPRDLYACCVDLGRQARDTHGNAVETRDWTRARGYRSLILVTSAYHMPRSLAEFRRLMPDVQLIPYPVQHHSLKLGAWARDGETFRLLLSEYLKYLVVRFA